MSPSRRPGHPRARGGRVHGGPDPRRHRRRRRLGRAVGDRHSRPRRGARGLRRPHRHLHRDPLRRRRGARLHGSHRVGGPAGRWRAAARTARGCSSGLPARRGAHGAHQRQRCGGGAHPRCRGGRRAGGAAAVANAHAAGVLRARGVDARADRHAGQHHRQRGGGRAGGRPFGYSSSRSLACRCSSGPSRHRAARPAAAAAHPDRAAAGPRRPRRALRASTNCPTASYRARGAGVTEVVVPPRSPLIGPHLFPGMATPSGDLVVLAVHRAGEPLEGRDKTLRAGDTLLLGGTWEHLEQHTRAAPGARGRRPRPLRRGVPLGTAPAARS